MRWRLLLGLVAAVSAQYSRQCEQGDCIPIKNCSYIQEYLRLDNKAFLKNYTTICGFEDKLPLICCVPIKVEDTIQFESVIRTPTSRPAPPPTTEQAPAPSTTLTITNKNPSLSDDGFAPSPINTTRIVEEDAIADKREDSPEERGERRECGVQSSDDLFDRIVGGSITKLSEFPWMARIKYSRANRSAEYLCGGSLISDRHVLTAAHCVTNAQFRIIDVRLGEWNVETAVDCDMEHRCSSPPVDVPPARVSAHPDFDRRTYHSDIAIVTLSRPVNFTEFVRPICLARLDDSADSYWAAGWGRTEYGQSSPIKMKVLLPAAPGEVCRSVFRTLTADSLDKIICAGGRRGTDTCAGDSGGPLMRYSGSKWYLLGVISLGGSPCGREGQPAVYTRVASYVDWIAAIMDEDQNNDTIKL